MPKLPRVNARATITALQRAGFEVKRQRGSHTVMENHERSLATVIPEHGGQVLAPGTAHALLKQAGLTVEEFIALLK